MKRVVFMGGKEIGYHCLCHLLAQQKELGAEIIAVLASGRMIFDPTLSIEKLCAEHNISFLHSLDEYLALENFDVLISVQYHQILKKKHIQKAQQIAVNLHMAPLPEYRGCNQFSFAIIDRAREFGTTLHRLEEGIDSGAILFEDRFAISQDIFVKGLYERTYQASIDLFTTHIIDILRGTYTPVPQMEFLNQRTHSLHYRKEMEIIKKIGQDWNIEKQKRHFRATYFPPLGVPYMEINGTKKELDLAWYESL